MSPNKWFSSVRSSVNLGLTSNGSKMVRRSPRILE